MKKSQIYAITRSYAYNRNKLALEIIESRGLLDEFKAKSEQNFSYWSPSRFLTHYEKYIQTPEERESLRTHLNSMIEAGAYYRCGDIIRNRKGKAVAYLYEC